MKDVVLTGISNEIDIHGSNKGQFFLVFNNGQLRIPVNEEAIETVLKYRQGFGTSPEKVKEIPNSNLRTNDLEDDGFEDSENDDWSDEPPSEEEIPSI